jgi:arylsulfatase A-like enzyme
MWTAACAAALLEVGLAYASGAGHLPGYYLASSVASLVAAVVLSAGAALLGASVPLALALWALVWGAAAAGPAVGVALAAAVLAAARTPSGRGLAPTRAGLVVGGALAGAMIAAEVAARRLPGGWPAPLTPVVLFAVALAAGVWLAARVPARLPARAALAALALPVGLLAGSAELRARRSPPAPPIHAVPGPHVFLIVLDTVRADHLSVYGYGRDTTPRLARRVAEHPGAAVYPWAFANGSWTAPSHATLLTGRLPSEHDVHLGTPTTRSVDWSMPTIFALHADRTLAERFADRGYATLAVFANLWLKRVEGLGRGFEVYTRVDQRPGLPLMGEWLRRRLTPSWFLDEVEWSPRADAVTRTLLEAVDAARGRNLFVLANYLDAHAPYRPPPAERGRFAPWSPFERPQALEMSLPDGDKRRLMARYDESLRGLDAALDRLLEGLEARGLLERSWIFVTADHGEAFGEHGVTDHGTGVYNPEIRVPLIVLPPRGKTLAPPTGPVSLASVAATAAAIAGSPLGSDADLRGGGPGRAIVEFYGDPAKARSQGRLGGEPALAIVSGPRKLIRYRDHTELFDLATDADEHHDLTAGASEEVAELLRALPEVDFTRAATAGDAVDPEVREQLEALGYLEAE